MVPRSRAAGAREQREGASASTASCTGTAGVQPSSHYWDRHQDFARNQKKRNQKKRNHSSKLDLERDRHLQKRNQKKRHHGTKRNHLLTKRNMKNRNHGSKLESERDRHLQKRHHGTKRNHLTK